ncbi:MAG: ATP-grasp domain-containing protein [Acidimicrobiales bacterium]
MARVLLVLPTATYRAAQYLAAAERLGAEIVIGSERAQALAAQMGEGFLELPLERPDEAARLIVAQARRDPRLRLDAVVAVDDQGLMTAALAAAELGLHHNPPGAVALTRDKAGMRAAFARAGVPQPDFAVIERAGADFLAEVAAAASRLGPPVVVKASSLSASRGVIRADSAAEAVVAARRINDILESDGDGCGHGGGELAGGTGCSPLLVERFVAGPEVAVEGIMSHGEAEIITVFDKPDPLDGPFFEETLYVSPSKLPPDVLSAVGVACRAAVRALGMTDGPFHAELRVPDASSVAVLEVAARTIGGRCSTAMVMEDGSSLEQVVIATALGIREGPARLASPCGILMIPIPATGTLVAVEGIDDARAVPGVTGVEISIPLGRPVRRLPEGDRYLGFVFAAAESPDAVEAALREAHRLLRIEIDADARDGDGVPGAGAGGRGAPGTVT